RQECGAPPPIAVMMCDDGTTSGAVCERRPDDGKCGWRLVPCPEKKGGDQVHNRDVCDKDPACRWLEPGCGDAAVSASGGYRLADLNCEPNHPCTDGRKCLTRNVDPCGGRPCGIAACGVPLRLCL